MDRDANAHTVDVRVRGFVPVEVVLRWSSLISCLPRRHAGQRWSGEAASHEFHGPPLRSPEFLGTHDARTPRAIRSLNPPDPNARAPSRHAAIQARQHRTATIVHCNRRCSRHRSTLPRDRIRMSLWPTSKPNPANVPTSKPGPFTRCRRIWKKRCVRTRLRLRPGKTSRRWHATSGFAGSRPPRKLRRGSGGLRGAAKVSRPARGGRAAGQVANTGKSTPLLFKPFERKTVRSDTSLLCERASAPVPRPRRTGTRARNCPLKSQRTTTTGARPWPRNLSPTSPTT